MKLGLVEAGRGCQFHCDFRAVQSMFAATQTRRPVDDIVAELAGLKGRHKMFFFVDDNITSNLAGAKELLRALAPLKIRWVSQASINAAHDEEFLELLVKSGCVGVLIGFETLNRANLDAMNKGFNTMAGGYIKAIANLRRHQIVIYGTFIFGYDHDTADTIAHAGPCKGLPPARVLHFHAPEKLGPIERHDDVHSSPVLGGVDEGLACVVNPLFPGRCS